MFGFSYKIIEERYSILEQCVRNQGRLPKDLSPGKNKERDDTLNWLICLGYIGQKPRLELFGHIIGKPKYEILPKGHSLYVTYTQFFDRRSSFDSVLANQAAEHEFAIIN